MGEVGEEMPAGYLKIKQSFIQKGYSEKQAETHAARIWNHNHPNDPVGRGEHKKEK